MVVSEQIAGKRASKVMRGQGFREPALLCSLSEHLVDGFWSEVRADEPAALVDRAQQPPQMIFPGRDPVSERRDRSPLYESQPLLVPFTEDTDLAALSVVVIKLERRELRAPHPRAMQEC